MYEARESRLGGDASARVPRKLGNRKGEKKKAFPTKIALSLTSSLFPSSFPSSCFDGSFCLPNSSSKSLDALHLCSVGDYNNLAESI